MCDHVCLASVLAAFPLAATVLAHASTVEHFAALACGGASLVLDQF